MMVRRSTPQKTSDEAAFPVRIKFVVPPRGLGIRLDDLHRWLANEIRRGQFAVNAFMRPMAWAPVPLAT